MLEMLGKNLVVLDSGVDVNVNLDDLYGELKDKTGVEEVGNTLKNDIISTAKWTMLMAGIGSIGWGVAKLVRKHDKNGWWMVFFGLLAVILSGVLFVVDK